MSDEQEQRRDPAGRRPEPDETREYGPLDDDDATRVGPHAGADDATPVSGSHPDGGTRSGDDWEPGGTAQMPPADDSTAAAPGPRGRDATSIMPPVGGDERWDAAEVPWSGRAEVRPPRPGEYASTDWSTEPPPEPRGKWWLPILVGVLALILLALLGWAIWLIAKAQNDPDNTPAPAATTAATAPETTPPTTQATTEAPTTQPTTTAPPTPSEVTVPALRGLSQQEAQQALSRRGLSSRLRFVSSADAPPGTVIDSDPAEGQEVPPDTVVTLVIAAQPPTSPTPGGTDQNDED